MFHGQYGIALEEAQDTKYHHVAEKNDFIVVYPQGMGDGNCGTGWNVGSGYQEGTCNFISFRHTCCYDSCKKLNLCTGDGKNAKCGWSTCYDDVFFV